MARVKIQPPEGIAFTTDLPLRITDMNYGGHLGNDSLLSLLHEARVQFFKSIGYSEMDFGGHGLIMADVAVQYRSEAFAGETLRIGIQPYDFTITGFDLYYEVTCASDQRLVAMAKTCMVCFDYTHKKMVDVPEAFRNQFTR
jgi:acyl-CoA thioester hydrolase